MAVVCALLSAFAYGIGDFIGGVGGRRSDLAWLIVADQVVALLGAVAGALILGGTLTPQVWVWGAVSGVGSGIGTVCLLRGLAAGRMTIVAPLSAVITAALPAVVGLFSGDRLTWSGWLGIALALPAVALASWSGAGSGLRMTDVGAGLIAGAGFGLMFVALDRAGGTEAGAWPLLPGQLVALLVVLAAAAPSVVGRRRPRRPVMIGAAVRWGGAAGLLGACANLLFLLSAGTGQLTVAAVLTALYPVVTVVLAVLVLKERLGYGQRAGLLTAAAAVVLIVTGS